MNFTKTMAIVLPLAFTIFIILLGSLAITGCLTPFLQTFGLPAMSVSSVLGAFMSVVIFKKMYQFLD